jgi:hypothetical protein
MFAGSDTNDFSGWTWLNGTIGALGTVAIAHPLLVEDGLSLPFLLIFVLEKRFLAVDRLRKQRISNGTFGVLRFFWFE